MKKRWIRGVICVCLIGGGSPVALGTTYRWAGTTTASGNFNLASNWTPAGGPPNDGSDTPIFDVSGTYTPRFSSFVTNNNFEVRVGIVTLDLFHEDQGQFDQDEAYEYTLDTTAGTAANITSFPGSLFAVKLIVQGDSDPAGGLDEGAKVHTSSFVHIGRDVNTNGTLELDNADWFGSQILYVGLNGNGTMKLYNDGDMSNDSGFVGVFGDAVGIVEVSGTSRWNNNGTLNIATQGSGTLNVEDGGVVVNDDDGFIASASGSVGNVTLDDGRWFNHGSLYVGGTSSATGGMATLTLKDDTPNFRTTALEIDNDMVIRSNGTVDMTGTSTLEVTGTLTIDAGGKLNVNATPFGVVNASSITGSAGTLNWTAGTVNITNGDFTVDANSPTGFLLSISTDMALNVSDTLRVGPTGNGFLIIANGGQATSSSVAIGGTGSIPIAIEGLGSTLTVSGDIEMGSVGGGGAQLVVTEQGFASSHNAFISRASNLHSELLLQSLNGGTAQWDSSGSVYLGGDDTQAGGTAELTVNTGGVANIAGQLRVWDQATVDVDTGVINTPLMHVSGQVTYTGTLDLTGAGPITALTLDGGSVTADEIDLGATDFTGHGTLAGDVIASGSLTANGNLTLGDANSFTALQLTGPLDVGTHTVTLHKTGFFNIGAFTTIAGGTLDVPNGAALPVGNSILAHGAITGRLVQQSGSSIIANGNLTLGDASSFAGFFSDGELTINDHTVTFLDANEAVLGSLTTLGDDGGTPAPGTLIAANGLIVEFGKNITGHGTIDTPNDPTTPLINNGFIGGDSVTEPITLNGYIKGVGTFGNIVINGTLSPGLSPGRTTVVGNLIIGEGAVLEMELGGLVRGYEYDAIDTAGGLSIDGVLEVKLIDGFTPSFGNTFDLFTFASIGGLNDIILPNLPNGLFFDTSMLLTDGSLTVVPDPSSGSALLAILLAWCRPARGKKNDGCERLTNDQAVSQ